MSVVYSADKRNNIVIHVEIRIDQTNQIIDMREANTAVSQFQAQKKEGGSWGTRVQIASTSSS